MAKHANEVNTELSIYFLRKEFHEFSQTKGKMHLQVAARICRIA